MQCPYDSGISRLGMVFSSHNTIHTTISCITQCNIVIKLSWLNSSKPLLYVHQPLPYLYPTCVYSWWASTRWMTGGLVIITKITCVISLRNRWNGYHTVWVNWSKWQQIYRCQRWQQPGCHSNLYINYDIFWANHFENYTALNSITISQSVSQSGRQRKIHIKLRTSSKLYVGTVHLLSSRNSVLAQ